MTRIVPILCFASLLGCQSSAPNEAPRTQRVERSGLRGVVITVDRLE